mmetsp:Transcript_24024/g.27204  ORF Transcript_24024/g.27204 Transcript_24024/m.27204 type:complete len:380 (+) Transcript_24024:30-1169(+)
MSSSKRGKELTILKSIVHPDYHRHMEIWHETATKEERKGLYLVQSIIKHSGKKRFKIQKEKKDQYAEILRPTTAEDVKHFAESFTKRGYSSSYGAFFAEKDTDKKKMLEKGKCILNYKKLADLTCSQYLSKISLIYIDHWLALGDDEDYKGYVLAFTRSVASAVRSFNIAVSHSRSEFDWKHKAAFTPHRLDKVKNLVRSKSGTRLFQTREIPKIGKIDVSEMTKKQKSTKSRKELLKCSSNFLDGLRALTPFESAYQDSFKTYHVHFEEPLRVDYNTSCATNSITPDPRTLSTFNQRFKRYEMENTESPYFKMDTHRPSTARLSQNSASVRGFSSGPIRANQGFSTTARPSSSYMKGITPKSATQRGLVNSRSARFLV